jgi:3-hydroxyacyl-[acyl-carrier-protein] dehydratase
MLNVNDIKKIIPHRYPFLLVDRIIDVEPQKRAVGIKNVSMNDHFLIGHFSDRPVMPSSLIIEAMAQVGGVAILGTDENLGKIALIGSIDSARFHRPVVPGDQLFMEAEIIKQRNNIGKLQAKASVAGKVVAEAELMFALVPE